MALILIAITNQIRCKMINERKVYKRIDKGHNKELVIKEMYKKCIAQVTYWS